MPENLTEANAFDANVSVPLDGVDRRTALSLRPAFQALANRTRNLLNRLTALEGLNIGPRLSAVEGQNLNARLESVEAAYDPLRFFHVVFSNYQNLDAINPGLSAQLVQLPLKISGGKAARLRRLTYYTPPNSLLSVQVHKKDSAGYDYIPSLSLENLAPGANYGVVEMRDNQVLTNGDGDYKIGFMLANTDGTTPLSPRTILLHALVEVL
jgi:hypothetical protein